MERERELTKLVNVLRRTASMAMQAEWTGNGDDRTAAQGVAQYNRVLNRLKALDPSLETLFEPLSEDSPLTVVAVACRQLAAYYEDEVHVGGSWKWGKGFAFDPESFKEFWQKSACDIEDLGEFIRENVEKWASPHRPPHGASPREGEDA